ncbi:PTS system beta-glucoside-specific IIBCA component [Tetragenococcus muriaticus 3MR10-3]|uniref:PTS system beta-glucoside-specific IIBCA component n=2 Tax=Tetragenococcus muriaticus TaxID=64642 RepID=A0A091CBW5_9ENTE|nr:PTS system beta-glucoside-specific IIBCA component [Tetragenococcus muriaticus 3MR10-3]
MYYKGRELMAKGYNKLAKEIIEHVGGENNVEQLQHCVTRLRFYLKDESKADTEYLKNLAGIVTVIEASGQYQIVIGNEVGKVYEAILNIANVNNEPTEPSNHGGDNKRKPLDKFIDLISGIFQPFIVVLSATGMIKGIVALLGVFGLNETNSGFYAVLNAVGDGFFQFLPVVIALTAAKKLPNEHLFSFSYCICFSLSFFK